MFLNWPEEDRAWAMALLAYEADMCSGCGQPRSESTHPGADGAYIGESNRCFGCAAVARASDAFSGPRADPRGIYIHVKRRDENRR